MKSPIENSNFEKLISLSQSSHAPLSFQMRWPSQPLSESNNTAVQVSMSSLPWKSSETQRCSGQEDGIPGNLSLHHGMTFFTRTGKQEFQRRGRSG